MSLGSVFCGENRLVEARAWKVLSLERRVTGAFNLAEMFPLKAITGTTDGLFQQSCCLAEEIKT